MKFVNPPMGSTDEPHGFEFRVERLGGDRWLVSLPHTCDRWDITDTSRCTFDSMSTSRGLPHYEAVTLMREFVGEAADALHALESRKELREL